MRILMKLEVLIFMLVLFGKVDGNAPTNYCTLGKWPVITNDECLEYKVNIAMGSKQELAFKVSSVPLQINGVITLEIWINDCHAMDLKRRQNNDCMYDLVVPTNSTTPPVPKCITNRHINFEWKNRFTVLLTFPDNNYDTSVNLRCPINSVIETKNGMKQKFVDVGIRYSRNEPQIPVEFSSEMYLGHVPSAGKHNHKPGENIFESAKSGKHNDKSWIMPLAFVFGTLAFFICTGILLGVYYRIKTENASRKVAAEAAPTTASAIVTGKSPMSQKSSLSSRRSKREKGSKREKPSKREKGSKREKTEKKEKSEKENSGKSDKTEKNNSAEKTGTEKTECEKTANEQTSAERTGTEKTGNEKTAKENSVTME